MTNIKKEMEGYFKSCVDTLSRVDRDSIGKLIEALLETREKDGTIYTFGNGGSAATAAHFCNDFITGVSRSLSKGFKAICLDNDIPALTAIANDISYEAIFVEQLKNFLRKDDLTIGFSASGNSMNVVKALEYARSVGAKTVAYCGYDGGKIKKIAFEMREALLSGDIEKIAHILDMEWENRKHLAKGVTNGKIDLLMSKAKKEGAFASKICGAGGGGCMITIAPPEKTDKVVEALK